jgi:tetratricopeptide (TPR) repeat protein
MRKTLFLIFCKLTFPAILNGQAGYDRDRLVQFYQNQEYGRAIEYLLPLSGLAADMIRFNNDLGYSYFMNEQYENALEFFMRVYRQEPSNTLASLYIAEIYADRKETDSSLAYYRNLIYYQPSNYRFWQKAAQVHYSKLQYDSSVYYFQKGYDINSRSGSLVVQYAEARLRLQQVGKADTLLQYFLAVDSSNRDVIAKRIDISYRKADYATAIHWGEKLWQDSVDAVIPYINLAYSYLATDSLDKCIALATWMEYKKRTTQSLVYCAAQAYAGKKDYTRSNELLDQCLKQSLQDDAVEYFNAKSDNYEAMKQYRKSISYYDTSYYIFKSPLDLYYTGRIYDKYLHNKEKAGYYYRKFVAERKNPRNSGERKVFDYIKEYFSRKE